jgi:aminoglycoside phosphotransferase (APT) family kinase protein
VLWQGERLAAVIDWEDAATGDPLADLANSKLEILWKWGAEAAEEFTRSYIAHRPLDLTDLPLWELYAALRHGPALANWGLDAATEAATRAHLRRLVEQSLAAL